MWGGGTPHVVSEFDPIIIKVRQNDSSINTIRRIDGSTVDVAFDLTEMLDMSQNESISESLWTTSNSALSVFASDVNGVLSLVRLTNNLPLGESAKAYCSMSTSIGRTIRRSLLIVSDQ